MTGSYVPASTWPGFVPCHRCGHLLAIRCGSTATTGKLDISGIPYVEAQPMFLKQRVSLYAQPRTKGVMENTGPSTLSEG